MSLINARHLFNRQTGAILPFLAIGMLAIVGVAGLAIDSSHAFVNVTRVQNAVDAAALSAAKTLNIYKDEALATADGTTTFAEHLEGEMDNVTVAFEYSNTLNPFVPNGADPNFVRATANDHNFPVFLARVLPGVADNWTVGATAVSGPEPLSGGEVCDIAPLLACGDPAALGASNTVGGLPIDGNPFCLKYGGGTNNGNNNNNNNNNNFPTECGVQLPDDPAGAGPGNYHLLALAGNGGSVLRQNLAGGFQGCADLGGTVISEPGNKTGPTSQGLNTRFGIYQGGGVNATDYPPDLVTTSPMTFAQYSAVYENGGPFVSGGQEERRVMAIPIADCSGVQNGRSDFPVLELGCYFIRQSISPGGQESYIVGELIENCNASGTPGGNPALGGPERIILYDDPGNPAS